MKYYLCKIGSFQDGGEERIKDDCLEKIFTNTTNGFVKKAQERLFRTATY